MTDIPIKITDDEITPALRQLLGQARNTRPAMRAIAETMQDSIEEAFEQESDPVSGMPWPQLAPATIRQRQRRGHWPGKMLQISQGGLANSIAASAGEDYAVAGTNKIYGPIHHFGGLAGRNHSVEIPARPYAGLTPEHRQEVLRIIQRHLSVL